MRHANGSASAKGMLKDGKKHGWWTFYRNDGSKLRAGSFQDGVEVGTWTTFDGDGQAAKKEVMAKKVAASGPVHALPADMRKALAEDPVARAAWDDITPLARNEWICWTLSVKKKETRAQHVERMREDLKNGKRRPCCWPGCKHR